MAQPGSAITTPDGTSDFSGGVNSIKVTTVQSQRTPNGLARNELAWMDNCNVRDGGILQRTGWQLLGTVHDSTGLYQGGFMYEPDSANPYLMLAISGQIYQVLLDSALPQVIAGNGASVSNISNAFANVPMPPTAKHYYFAQAENFLVIQAGDLVTLPLFWDGTILRKSKGITNAAVPPNTNGINEIPASGPMDYFMQRLWYVNGGRQYSAGDIAGSPSGTLANHFRDAVLNVTQAPLVLSGNGFTVPDNAGNIRSLFHNANLDSTLGQGQLMIGTRKAVYSLQVPVAATDWIGTTQQNQPKQIVVQLGTGPVNDRSVVPVNGDVFYQTLEPSISSLFAATRYFDQWGNRNIASNEQRILSFVNRALLEFASGIEFDNRLLQTSLPLQTPQGVVHQAIIPMDFIPISNFLAETRPIWQGMYEGIQILQLFAGDFGGLKRSFAVTVSTLDSSIQVWEITNFLRSDFQQPGAANVPESPAEARVTWYFETPAFTWGDETALKKLVSLELFFDKIFGNVTITVESRPDFDPCWNLWWKWQECSARNSCEDVNNPVCYPVVGFREGYRASRTLPLPPDICNAQTGRPWNIGYQHQLRITVHGWMRFRSILLHAEPYMEELFHEPPPPCS